MLHRDRRHAGAHPSRAHGGCVRSRDPDALAEELHGADGGSVRLHPRGSAGGRGLREHRGGGAQPLLLHTEPVAGGGRRTRDRHRAGVQGTCDNVSIYTNSAH